METATLQPIQTPGRRHAPRYAISVPVNVTVLRSGVPTALPGRSVDIGEGGICAVLAGDLQPGEPVGVEFRLPHLSLSVLAKARVCYQLPMRCGMEFLGLSGDQQSTIRFWAERTGMRRTKAEIAASHAAEVALQEAAPEVEPRRLRLVPPTISEPAAVPAVAPASRTGRWDRFAPYVVSALCVAVLLAMLWWRWEQSWQDLEAKLPTQRDSLQTPTKVPTEAMLRLLVHKVQPISPENTGGGRLSGVVVLDAVIGTDGSVVRLRSVSGAEPLAKAAMDAVRWWRFEPYRVNGQPVDAETTFAVQFE